MFGVPFAAPRLTVMTAPSTMVAPFGSLPGSTTIPDRHLYILDVHRDSGMGSRDSPFSVSATEAGLGARSPTTPTPLKNMITSAVSMIPKAKHVH